MGWFFKDQFDEADEARNSPCKPGMLHVWESAGYGYGYSTYTCKNCGTKYSLDLDIAEVR